MKRDLLTVNLEKLNFRLHEEFMDFLDESIPSYSNPPDFESQFFYQDYFNNFLNLPVEFRLGFYLKFLSEKNIDVSNIDINNLEKTIIQLFNKVKQ
jgi:hypothetical protein